MKFDVVPSSTAKAAVGSQGEVEAVVPSGSTSQCPSRNRSTHQNIRSRVDRFNSLDRSLQVSPHSLLLFLIWTSLVATTVGAGNTDTSTKEYSSSSSIRRQIQEDDDGTNTNVLSDLLDRLDGDMNYMWTSSPSEWNMEYWEVFAIFAALSFLLAMFVCYVFCVVPCSDTTDHPGGGDLTEMTQSEFDAHQRSKRQRSRLLSKMRGNNTNNKQVNNDNNIDGVDNTTDDWESPFVLMTDANGKEVTSTTPATQQPQQGPDGELLLPSYSVLTKSPTARARDDLLMDEDAILSSRAAAATFSSVVSNDSSPPSSAAIASGILTTTATSADPPAISTNASSGGLHELNNTGTAYSKRSAGTSRDNKATTKRRGGGGTNKTGSLWSETVDVWSEFLGFHRGPKLTPALLVNDDDDDDVDRRRSPRMSTRTGSSSGRRKSSSKRSGKGKSVDADDAKLLPSKSKGSGQEQIGRNSSRLSVGLV
jgi:hypothetical protein